MKILIILLVAAVAGIVGWFLGQNRKKSFIVDLERALEEEKAKAVGERKNEKNEKARISKLSAQHDELLKEKNAVQKQVSDSRAEMDKLRAELTEALSAQKEVKIKLAEVNEVWQEKLDAAKAESDEILRVRDQEAADWQKRMDEIQEGSTDHLSKLKEKNARIDELNALIMASQKKLERHDEKYKKKIASLESELKKARRSSSPKKERIESTKESTEIGAKESAKQVNAPAAAVKETPVVVEAAVITPSPDGAEPKKAAAPSKADTSAEADDLTKVEGIGPKIAELLGAQGITTFSGLGDCTVEQIKGILETAGPAYTRHTPDTWPKQAQMAASGQWDELKAWQDVLDGGKEV